MFSEYLALQKKYSHLISSTQKKDKNDRNSDIEVKQLLVSHLLAISFVGAGHAKKIGLGSHQLTHPVFISCLLSDVGKAVSSFQDYIKNKINDKTKSKKKKKETFISHPEVSLIVSNYLEQNKAFTNMGNKDMDSYWRYIMCGILHHHERYFFTENGKKKLAVSLKDLKKSTNMRDVHASAVPLTVDLMNFYSKLNGHTFSESFNKHLSWEIGYYPSFFNTDDLESSSLWHLFRSSCIFADRSVSKFFNQEQLERFLEKVLSFDDFDKSIDYAYDLVYSMDSTVENSVPSTFPGLGFQKSQGIPYENISNDQVNLAKEASKNITSIISAPPGWGKTLLGLNWISNLLSSRPGTQTFWILPRNAPAKGTYYQVLRELSRILGEDHTISVELFLTGKILQQYSRGEKKSEALSSSIVVTNIDSILNPHYRLRHGDRISTISDAFVVFDEYHELVSSDPLFYFFMQMMFGRHRITKSPTLLLSATPLPIHQSDHGWDIEDNKTFVKNEIDHWSKKPIHLKFNHGVNHLMDHTKGFTVFNSVEYCQRHALKNKTNLVLHGKFTDKDKNSNLDSVIKLFGYDNWKSNPSASEKSVSSAQWLNASLNVSHIFGSESLFSPMRTLQFAGRLNRFGLSDYCNLNVVSCLSGPDSPEKRAVRYQFDLELAELWGKALEEKSKSGENLTIDCLRVLYFKFFEDNKTDIKEWIRIKFTESEKKVESLAPVIKSFDDDNKDKKKIKTSQSSLRAVSSQIFLTASCYYYRNDYTYSPANKLLSDSDLLTVNERYNQLGYFNSMLSGCAEYGLELEQLLVKLQEKEKDKFEYAQFLTKNYSIKTSMSDKIRQADYWTQVVARFNKSPMYTFPASTETNSRENRYREIYLSGEPGSGLPNFGLIRCKLFLDEGSHFKITPGN